MNEFVRKPHAHDVHIGERIRIRRVILRISQEALAERIGVTFQQIQKYERGANRVSGSRMVQIAHALATEPAYFFEGLERSPGLRDASLQKREAEFLADLSSPEGRALNSAFARIRDPKMRKSLVAMAKLMASGEEQEVREAA